MEISSGSAGTLPGACARLSGDLLEPAVLSVAALRVLAAYEVEAAFQCRRTGMRRHVFAGPLLVDVIRAARPTFDPEFGDTRALLATPGPSGESRDGGVGGEVEALGGEAVAEFGGGSDGGFRQHVELLEDRPGGVV